MLVATRLQFHLVFSTEIPGSHIATGAYYPSYYHNTQLVAHEL
jgi:hypothetical protein